jgi:hypothetical protein
MADRWLEDGGENALAAITPQWLVRYLTEAPDAQMATHAHADFYRWAVRAGLLDRDPLVTAAP